MNELARCQRDSAETEVAKGEGEESECVWWWAVLIVPMRLWDELFID